MGGQIKGHHPPPLSERSEFCVRKCGVDEGFFLWLRILSVVWWIVLDPSVATPAGLVYTCTDRTGRGMLSFFLWNTLGP